MVIHPRFFLGGLWLLLLGAGGCATLRQGAINEVGDALAGGGATIAQEDDPDLVRDAAPTNLLLMESLLAQSPEHRGLLLALTSGFTQYSYAFVQEDADEIEARDFAGAEAGHARAKRLYLRARDFGLRGLEAAHPGFAAALAKDPRAAVAVLTVGDVPQLYWTAAAWGGALALGGDDTALLGEMPQMEALLDRALALDGAWNHGAIHGFLITYEMDRQGAAGKAAARAAAQFELAVQLSGGQLATPYVAYAEAICEPAQDAAKFDEMLNQALAINPDAHPEFRLENLIMQRRARWLLTDRDNLFLAPAAPGK